MLSLYIQAPFAAFRTLTAGSFLPTARFITHSAAYGLLLNVAGIEMRRHDGKSPMTLIRTGLPRVRLALAAVLLPAHHTIYQQLHNYPVGDSGKEHAPATRGTKYNIVPGRRAFLSDIRAYLCVDGDTDFEARVERGLDGEARRAYGLPFLGDNNFLIDRLEVVADREPAFWFVPVEEDADAGLREHVTRLTITIDRQDMSRTTSALFAPTETRSGDVPAEAWVEVGY